MGSTFYVTTPIYYVNDVPHLGHAYTTVAADTVARMRRLAGEEVFFLTGTDEHGQKIENAARKAGLTPRELADRVVVRFRRLWEVLGISNSDFIRTTEERHHRAVEELYRRVSARGDVYLGRYEGWYNVRDESFVTETQLEEIRAMPEERKPELQWVQEESYFFRLSRYRDALLDHYRRNPDFVRPRVRMNEVVRFVEGGLRDLSISRTSFSWGIPVPGDEKHVFYVWFDALTNYLTAAGFPHDEQRFRSLWPCDIHFVGKDILRFHAVYWPAFLMSAGLEPPRTVFAHGWWTVEGEKMSKSLGNVVDPYAVVDEFGSDVLRYFLLREIPFGQDGDFSRRALVQRANGELANGLGNLVSRTLGMIERYCGGAVPEPGPLEAVDEAVAARAAEAWREMSRAMDDVAFHKALAALWDYIGFVNRYVDEAAPWTLRKEGRRERLDAVLYTLAAALRAIALLSAPFIPEAAAEIWRRLGMEGRLEDAGFASLSRWRDVRPGQRVTKGRSLFPRHEE